MKPTGYAKLDAETQATFDNEIASGRRYLRLDELEMELRRIGYRLDDDSRAYCRARWMTGEMAGRTYDCCTIGVAQLDNGLSFANIEARRDDNFRTLQTLRQEVFSLARNHGTWYIAEI